MEALRKLERMQKALSSLQARGLSTNNRDSDRFLAHLLLFLAEPCGMLNMDKKFTLIYENLSKISSAILEDALLSEIEEDCEWIYPELPSQLSLENRPDVCFLEAKVEEAAKIGFHAMQKANSTLEDFVDAMNEKDLHLLPKVENKSMELNHELSGPDPLDPLVYLLQGHGLMTERIKTELRSGSEYWALERKLCYALKRRKKIFIEDVMRAIHLKSFDYRVLNLLLYKLRGQQVNELHMKFLSVSEFLVEISDDLYDYEAKCITEAEEKYERLSRNLDPDLSSSYWKRCEDATKEGGKTSGHPFGTWSIPPVIVDEESYRMKAINCKASCDKV